MERTLRPESDPDVGRRLHFLHQPAAGTTFSHWQYARAAIPADTLPHRSRARILHSGRLPSRPFVEQCPRTHFYLLCRLLCAVVRSQRALYLPA